MGQTVGGALSEGLSEANQSGLSRSTAGFVGSVFGAGISSQVVNARGGDGDKAFLNAVVNSAVETIGASTPRTDATVTPIAAAPSNGFVGTVFDDDSNLMLRVVLEIRELPVPAAP